MLTTKLFNVTLTTLLFVLFLGCTRRDLMDVPGKENETDVAEWLKREFSRSTAHSLLHVKFSENISYGMSPNWEEVSEAQDEKGNIFYYIPLTIDRYATVSGNKRSLSLKGVKTYLIAYAEDRNTDNLAFIKGEFLINDNISAATGAKAGSAAASPTFSGKAIFSSSQGQTAIYQYAQPVAPTARQSNGANTLLTARTPYQEYSGLLLGFVYGWGIPDAPQVLSDLDDEWRYGTLPFSRPATLLNMTTGQTYPNPFSYEQWKIVYEILRSIDFYYLADGGTGTPTYGQTVCELKCHWGADCSGSGTGGSLGGIAVTVTTSQTGFCLEPTNAFATCSEGFMTPWYLVRSETGNCKWSPGTGTGGGGSFPPLPPPPPAAYTEISHDLTDPCLVAMYNKYTSAQWDNLIARTTKVLFGRFGKTNLRLHQTTSLPASTDAITSATESGGIVSMDIDLNLNVLPNSSQEYIIATILHEVLHAQFHVSGMNDVLDHDTMANEYISLMADALQEIFPNLANDREVAVALAWGGLYKTLAWPLFISSNPTQAQAIINMNNAHKAGTSGTICL